MLAVKTKKKSLNLLSIGKHKLLTSQQAWGNPYPAAILFLFSCIIRIRSLIPRFLALTEQN